MKIRSIKTIGAIVMGAALFSSVVAPAFASFDVPQNRDWFMNEDGQPNVIITVGAQANASDVVASSIIAAQIGNMANVETMTSQKVNSNALFDNVGIYNYEYEVSTKKYGNPKAPATWYTDYELYSSQYWETAQDGLPLPDNVGYTAPRDINVLLAMPDTIENLDKNIVAQKLNTLWYSQHPVTWDSRDLVYKAKKMVENTKAKGELVNIMATTVDGKDINQLAGGSYDNGDAIFNNVEKSGYSYMDTEAWINVSDQEGAIGVYNQIDDCDYPFGGTGTEMEAHEEIQIIPTDIIKCGGDSAECSGDGIVDFSGDKGPVSGIIYRTTEIRYPPLEAGQNLCGITKCDGMVDFSVAVSGYTNEIKFLGKYYNPVLSGATYNTQLDRYLGGYFVHGKPVAEKEKILKVGEVYSFKDTGWVITVNDINIYENKAYLTVERPQVQGQEKVAESFVMVFDAQDACGPCCPECSAYGGGGAFTSNPTQKTEYDPYKVVKTVYYTDKDTGMEYEHFKFTTFVLDGVKTFVGAAGNTYLIEVNIYALEDAGYMVEKGCCDPFLTTPNDYNLVITGGWRKVAYNSSREQRYPAWVPWEEKEDEDKTEFGLESGYVLWMPEPQFNVPCGDANFDTLELRLCDKIEIPDCETTYTLNGPENYFAIELSDVAYGKGNSYKKTYEQLYDWNASGSKYHETKVVQFGTKEVVDEDGLRIKIVQSSELTPIKYIESVRINPTELIKLDVEINTTMNTKNIIMVGGPVYNTLVKDIMDMGKSQVNWAASNGDIETIRDPYGKGYDVMIVAGANREETRLAAEELVRRLN